MSEPIVEVEGLRKVFPMRGRKGEDFVAVAGVSFTVAPGSCLGIVGESGSGKTTVARMIVGLETPTSGRIVVSGVDRSTRARSRSERRQRATQTQMVFQDPYTSLDRRQTGYACLDEVLRLHGGLDRAARRVRIGDLAEQVGLSLANLAARPGQLSGGQRQRIAIARALAAEPAVVVLDESVSALDVSVQAQVLNRLSDIRAELAISYIFVSHDLSVIRQMCDDVVVVQAGEVVETGSVEEVLDRPQHAYTRLLRDSIPGPGWSPRREG